jgi:hypothetical protein
MKKKYLMALHIDGTKAQKARYIRVSSTPFLTDYSTHELGYAK